MTHQTHTSKPAHRFAVVGGDGRMTYLAQYLAKAGYAVRVFGCGEECLPDRMSGGDLRICTTLAKSAESATALILPLPTTRDGETVHCPRDPGSGIPLKEVTALMQRDPHLLLFGGNLPPSLYADPALAARTVDYNRNEEFLQKNAEITAEAAVVTAMEVTDYALMGVSVAVVGYGRIGKCLSRRLHALGAAVTVCARRRESLAEAAAAGYEVLLLDPQVRGGGLLPLCGTHPILFNTVPAHVLRREFLLAWGDALVIDLASTPFGVTNEDVREASSVSAMRYLRAPSLPGSYAPRDAGEAIGVCILNTLHSLQKGEDPL